jgi:hypothetical protein
VKLVGACRVYWVTRSDVGPHNLKNLWKGIVECMMGMLGKYLDRGWFYCRPSFRVGVEAVMYCWNRCSSNFSFSNTFVIVLCHLLVDSNTFLKMRVFKMSYWLH